MITSLSQPIDIRRQLNKTLKSEKQILKKKKTINQTYILHANVLQKVRQDKNIFWQKKKE